MRSPASLFSPVLIGLLALTLLCPCHRAHAQVTKTARIELDDAHEKFPLGTQIYLTQDFDQKLTEQVIATRHNNNFRGLREDSTLINLGLFGTPSWLVFSVTNTSSKEDWVLDFGTMMQGRFGMVKNFSLFRQANDQLTRIATHDTATPATNQIKYDTAIPLKIRHGATELFIAYFEMANASPGLIKPVLINNEAFIADQAAPSLWNAALFIVLIMMAAFFVTIAYVQRARGYGLFGLYYAGLLLLCFFVNHVFFLSFSFESGMIYALYPLSILCGLAGTRFFLEIREENHTENTLFISSGFFIVVATMLGIFFPFQRSVMEELLIFIPAQIGMVIAAFLSFTQAQNGKYAGHYLALGWIMALAGSLITAMDMAGVFDASLLLANMFWLALLPQAGFFAAGMAKKIHLMHQDERQHILRDSRAAHSQAKLKQSKESADQARLMRVIERERELMVELREREIQRTEEMRLAKEAADEANKAKSSFLAVVSHEIRTPMTGIMGVLKLMQDTRLNQEQRDYLMTIQKSGDTMVALLNDILDFEKIEKGSVSLENIDFDLSKLIQGVVTLMTGHAVDKNVRLSYDIPDNFPAYLKGDPARLRQVLLNLVSNAIKFTENGMVIIRLQAMKLHDKPAGIKGDYEIYFAVEDTGIGISASAQDKLFSPFEQADATITRKYGGTGLGLAISQRLIAAMGSAIRITSEEHKGSVFFFTILMEEGNEELAEEHNQYKQPVQTSASRMRILIIEDNAINRKILQKFLEKDSHVVTAADSGEVALSFCRDQTFDVIFTDINLSGGMSGLDFARTLRQSTNHVLQAMPIIAVTGNVSSKDAEDIERAGINGFIRKPIPYEELHELLAEVRKGNLAPLKPEDAIVTLVQPAQMAARKADIQIIQRDMLDGLMQSLGRDQTKQLMESCLDKSDEIIKALQEPDAISEKDFIRDRAHELHGMAANFGMSALSDLAARLEQLSGQNNFERVLFEMKELPKLGADTRTAIEAWLAQSE